MDWGIQYLTSSGALFMRDVWARASFTVLEAATGNTGHDWLGGPGFPQRPSRFYFQGKLELNGRLWLVYVRFF